MSTHIICFHGEIKKILCGYHLLFGAIVICERPAVYILALEKDDRCEFQAVTLVYSILNIPVGSITEILNFSYSSSQS